MDIEKVITMFEGTTWELISFLYRAVRAVISRINTVVETIYVNLISRIISALQAAKLFRDPVEADL